eukprot:GEMP01007983.1.p1 GENE.GEMP01007983.1~~GEMP01007983.1.p1  ORF type:complete len:714 (+),score=166.43 GEMP01007983.1:259-2400(+)
MLACCALFIVGVSTAGDVLFVTVRKDAHETGEIGKSDPNPVVRLQLKSVHNSQPETIHFTHAPAPDSTFSGTFIIDDVHTNSDHDVDKHAVLEITTQDGGKAQVTRQVKLTDIPDVPTDLRLGVSQNGSALHRGNEEDGPINHSAFAVQKTRTTPSRCAPWEQIQCAMAAAPHKVSRSFCPGTWRVVPVTTTRHTCSCVWGSTYKTEHTCARGEYCAQNGRCVHKCPRVTEGGGDVVRAPVDGCVYERATAPTLTAVDSPPHNDDDLDATTAAYCRGGAYVGKNTCVPHCADVSTGGAVLSEDCACNNHLCPAGAICAPHKAACKHQDGTVCVAHTMCVHPCDHGRVRDCLCTALSGADIHDGMCREDAPVCDVRTKTCVRECPVVHPGRTLLTKRDNNGVQESCACGDVVCAAPLVCSSRDGGVSTPLCMPMCTDVGDTAGSARGKSDCICGNAWCESGHACVNGECVVPQHTSSDGRVKVPLCADSDSDDCSGPCCGHKETTRPSSTKTQHENATATTNPAIAPGGRRELNEVDAKASLRCPCDNGTGSIFRDYCLEKGQQYCAKCNPMYILKDNLCVHYLELYPEFPVGVDPHWLRLWTVSAMLASSLLMVISAYCYTRQVKRTQPKMPACINSGSIPQLNTNNRDGLSSPVSSTPPSGKHNGGGTRPPQVYVYSPTSASKASNPSPRAPVLVMSDIVNGKSSLKQSKIC